MKLGYSILLGETLEASVLQYRDCERFQVICPVCKEPIFKVRRPAGKLEEMHYFSHYASQKAYQGQCELRVTGTEARAIAHANAVSREQRLTYFLSVLRRTIGNTPIYTDSAEKTHWKMNKSPAVLLLRSLIWEQTVLPNREVLFDQGAEDYLWSLDESGWALATTFSLERQRQIARDMWLMICTPAGHGNFDFLWNHAFMREFNTIIGSVERNDGLERQVMNKHAEYMMRILEAKKSDVDPLLHEMASTLLPATFNKIRGEDDPSGDQSTFFTRMLSNVTIEMFGTLLELPYFELLKQQYGDPSKIYPYQPGSEPVDPDEIERMKTWQQKHRRPYAH